MHPPSSENYIELFSINNIFYFCLKDGSTQEDVCKLLSISRNTLFNKISRFFVNLTLPTFSDLRRAAITITESNISISQWGRLFLFCKGHPEFKLNSQHIEYLLYPKKNQFDHVSLFNYFEDTDYFRQIKSNYSKIMKIFNPNDSLIFDVSDENQTPEIISFRNAIRIVTNLPECLKKLSNRQRYFVNMALSLAYLGAKVFIDMGGHSSPHLKGQFLAQVRQDNTGILSTENNIVREVSDEEFNEIKEWFVHNNHLYSGNLVELDLDNFINDYSKTSVLCSISDRRVPNNILANVILPSGLSAIKTNLQHKYEVKVRKRRNPNEVIWMPLESALPLMFPVLFPYGSVPLIPGSTIRKKAQNLLLSCDNIRNTSVGCQLILFLYDNIMRCEYNYSRYQSQRINFPVDGNRTFTPVPRAEDPSFYAYWAEKESEIKAMTYHYGYPDAMLTLTFNSKWDDIHEKRILLGRELFNAERALDTCYMPFEVMKTWDKHYKIIASQKFKPICQFLGLGNVTHYVSRLEFQLRGAPHAHVLLWLEKPLSINQIDELMSARIPSIEFSPILHHYVKGNMIHNCIPSRCYRNPNHMNCKYGFPKNTCQETCIDTSGHYQLKRYVGDERVVDYHSLLLLLWKGHVHLMFLKTEENPNQISSTGHYVLKYNMKPEPSYEVNLSVNDAIFAQILARVVSVEESIARIFSLTFCVHDSECIHKGGGPPGLRNASFDSNGNQIQLDPVQIYYNRPLELEGIGFADFWSWYKVIPAKNGESWIGQSPDFNRIRPPNTLNRDDPNYGYENNFVYRADIKLPMPIYTDPSLNNAKQLVAVRRKKPVIVVLNKYDLHSNREHYYFHIIFLSGCWRSDTEIKSNFETFEDAAKYHGILSSLGESEIDNQFRTYIYYMVNSNRYSSWEIGRNISIIEQSTNSLDINQILNELSITHPQRIQQIHQCIENFRIIDQTNIETQSIDDDTNDINELIGLMYTDFDVLASALKLTDNIRKLNEEQLIAYNLITRAIRLGDGNESRFFIYGKAGTGKSYLIHMVQQFCIANRVSFITTASTGIAASLIDGQTFHSAFSIWSSPNGPISTLNISNHRGLAMSRVQVIIVDEVTMLDRSVINAASSKLIELSERRGNYIQQPFAGKTVIFLGDPSQVPAVTNAHDDMTECAEQFMHSAGFNGFIPIQLKKLMRQNDEDQESFRLLLNEVSKIANSGSLSVEHQNMLKSRFHQENISEEHSIMLALQHAFPESNSRGMIITYKNDRANIFNHFALSKIINANNKKVRAYSIMSVAPDHSYRGNQGQRREQNLFNQQLIYHTRPATDHEIRLYLNALAHKETKCIIPFTFDSAIGARVMLMKNLNVKEKLINGARGVIVGYEKANENDNLILAINVKFDFQERLDHPIQITRRIVNTYKTMNGLSFNVYQFPLRLAWAVTAHKAQGQTLDKVSIDIGSSAFAHGAFYVALSRVRKLQDLMFFGAQSWPENGIHFHVNDFIQQQTNAINDEAAHHQANYVNDQRREEIFENV